MKQVLQDVTGTLRVVEVAAPALRRGGVLVQTSHSVVSAGTERQTIALARKNLIGKALSRPDLVRQVLQKARAEGVGEAARQAQARLARPIPLGYSSAGIAAEIGPGVEGIRAGDRVACSGLGFASHAEVVSVPRNMLAVVPDEVSLEDAAFGGVGAIALHGIRMGEVELGSRAVVIGLGLLGLITVQLLRAAGCHVFGTDLREEKVKLALDLGAEGGAVAGEDVAGAVRAFTAGHGADVVLIAASTSSAGPLALAAEVARDRARVVAVGAIRLDAPRRTFYEKELHLVVPRSSGPGIDDDRYETKGVDYPIAYARWTHARNLDEFLRLLAEGKVSVSRLITHRFPLADAPRAYDTLAADGSVIGLVFTYPAARPPEAVPIRLAPSTAAPARDVVGVGLIGAGLFATGTLLPVLRAIPGVRLRGVATATGVTGRVQGERFGFEYATTEARRILDDDQIDAVIIATRHDLHASLTAEALVRGKAVLVEKPLAISPADLEIVLNAWRRAPGRLMVGFNRRFAPLAVEAKRLLQGRAGPALVHCRVNVGPLPSGSWLLDPEEGGGVAVGEMGHFIDLIQYFCDSRPISVQAAALRPGDPVTDILATIVLADGSLGSVLYTVKGDKALERERIEMFKGGTACVIDNFRRLQTAQGGRTRTIRRGGVDRGHRAELEAFIDALRGGRRLPVDLNDYLATTLATFAIGEALSAQTAVPIVLPAADGPRT